MGKLLDTKREGNLQIVHEFYAQVSVQNVWRFSLRGVDIDFTLGAFRQYLNLPFVEECEYKYYKNNDDEVPEDEISKLLDSEGEISWQCPTGRKKYLSRTRLSVEARIWMHFGKDYFWASSNRSRITRDQALIIFILMKKQPVDIGHLIFKYLQDHVLDQTCGLMLPHLISAFCIAKGVAAVPMNVSFKLVPKFQYTNIKPKPTQALHTPHPLEHTHIDVQASLTKHGEPSSSSQPQPTMHDLFSMMQNLTETVGQCLTTLHNQEAVLHNQDARLIRIEAYMTHQAQ